MEVIERIGNAAQYTQDVNPVTSNIPPHWLTPLWLLAALLLARLVQRIEWRRILQKDDLNVFLGATVAVLLLWLINTGIKPGLSFHLLGATVLTLMFGPWFALLSLGLLDALTGLWQAHLSVWPANWLLNGAIPVLVTWSVFRFVDRKLPNHFFIYIFINAFFGAALAISLLGIASTALVALSGAYTLDYLLDEYLPYYLLMAWAEAFSSGMMVTLLVVYKPAWVTTFDDARYLNR